MESAAKEMKYFVKIVMVFILSLLLTGCKSQPKVNISKDAKQPKPTYTQTDYDALRDAVLSDGFVTCLEYHQFRENLTYCIQLCIITIQGLGLDTQDMMTLWPSLGSR